MLKFGSVQVGAIDVKLFSTTSVVELPVRISSSVVSRSGDVIDKESHVRHLALAEYLIEKLHRPAAGISLPYDEESDICQPTQQKCVGYNSHRRRVYDDCIELIACPGNELCHLRG